MVMTVHQLAFDGPNGTPRRDRRGPGLAARRRQGRLGRRLPRHRRRRRRLRVSRPPIALVHDYLTQRGGAERVVLTLADAYPDAAIHTSLYDPGRARSREFATTTSAPSPSTGSALLRDHHRLALPLLAPAFSPPPRRRRRHHLLVERLGPRRPRQRGQDRLLPQPGPLALPARPVPGRVVAGWPPPAWRSWPRRSRRWDTRAAATADRYLVNSRAVRARVADVYGIDADVVPPPVDIDRRRPAAGPGRRRARLRPVRVPAAALQERGCRRRGVRPLPGPAAGGGRDRTRWPTSSPPRRPPTCTVLGRVEDDELRWLYGVVPSGWWPPPTRTSA